MSAVPIFIDFEAEEIPKWRKESKNVTPVQEMIKKIVEYQCRWRMAKESVDTTILEKVKCDSLIDFFCHVSTEEGEGCTTREDVALCLDIDIEHSLSQDQRKTVNLRAAYEFLLNEVKKEDVDNREESHGLLAIDLLTETHKLIMTDLTLPKNATRPGEFSKSERYTHFNGERYSYQNPENMEEAVQILVDNYNPLLRKFVKKQQDPEACVYNMFKICSWLLFELLDLHPFSDGNGRLCRLLCSYALSSMTPFPTPIYNVWSESKKSDYVQALVDARKSPNRHPTSLITMIIECNYTGWKKFFEKVSEYGNEC